MHSRSHLRVVFAACIAAIASICACSNQGEGEVCDSDASNGGNDDCQSGLTCQSRPLFGTRCCPVDLQQATTAACSATHEMANANPSIPDASPDATPADGGADAPSETATATDAPAASPDSAVSDGPGESGIDAAGAIDAKSDGTTSDGATSDGATSDGATSD